jgi:PAS domain S-box-containing protein
MKTKRRFTYLFLTMLSVVFVITSLTVFMVFQTTIRDFRFNLSEMLKNQVSIVQSIYNKDKDKDQVLQLIHNSQEIFGGIGETGEFTIAEKRNDTIIFLLDHRNSSVSGKISVPFHGTIAIPMKKALSGETGTVIGKDYRNVKVLAAYTYIGELGWGAIVKIDMAEIQKPFINTILISLSLSILLVIIGSLLFTKITNPLIHELKENEEKYRLLIEGLTDLIVKCDKEGHLVFVSISYLEKAGKSEKELIGKKYLPLVHADDQEVTMKAMESLYYSPHTSYVEMRIKIKDGWQWTAWSNKATMDDNGNIKEIVGVGRDITLLKKSEQKLLQQQYEVQQKNEEYQTINEELKENIEKIQTINYELLKAKEKAEESDRLKMVFLSNISHEIRTPMNAIMGFSELLENPEISIDKQEKFTQIIRRRSADLLTIINDILEISKIDAGQFTIYDSPGNINDMFKELHQYYDARNKMNNKENIIFNILSQINNKQALINGDFGRIKQIIMNLVDNAFKFTEEGTIDLGCYLSDNSQIVFYVKDTGIGIPEDKHNLIFERFRQIEETHKRKFGGTGLGLPICKGIAELMGGTIWLESEINKGSTFYFSIPYKPLIKVSNDTEVSTEQIYNWRSKCIMVIEDDNLSATFFKEILKHTKAKCLFADNGKKAIEIFKTRQKIDVVLMDIRLPDIDGFELTKLFKSIDPKVIIIAQTAYAGEDDKIKCLEAGCDDYISKPVNRDGLFQIIQKHFENAPPDRV